MKVKGIGRHLAVAAGVAVLSIGSVVYAGQAGAQTAPTAAATTSCDPEGQILVEIVDDFSTTYDVFIDGELVDEDVTDSDGGAYAYGPFEDGTYNVVVTWIDGDEDILDVDVTVDCSPDATTTTTTTTTTTVPAAPAPGPAAAPAAEEMPIRFTG